MQVIEGFALAQHSGPYEKWPEKTRLSYSGRDTGTAVSGYVIEAQYRCAMGYLLILSFDCLYEESNEFVLLDADFRSLARRSLGVPYDTYLIAAHWPVADNALLLRYQGGECFRLTIAQGWFGRWKLRLDRAAEIKFEH